MTREELAARLYEAAHVTGAFTLRSGSTTDEYFDKYRAEADPDLLAAMAGPLAELVPPDTEVLGGLELGGVPLVTALSLATGLPAAFVRKQAKTYGTCRLAEGSDVAARRVLVVEDVVTSGGQMADAVRRLREIGASITSAICVVDREAGAVDALADQDVALTALFRLSEINGAVHPG